MIAYNVKVKDFLDGQHISIYSRSIVYNVGKKQKNEKEIENIEEPIIEPFTGKDVLSEQMQERKIKDMERSVANSVKRTKNNIIDYSRSNVWEWFLTLTFGDAETRMDYAVCSEKLSNWLDNTKRLSDYQMKYVVVPEQHKKGGYHFHALVSNADCLRMVESGHFTKDGDIIYNIDNYNMGFTTATRIKDTEKASNYITKYITKELAMSTKGKKRYWCSKNLDTPKITMYNYDTMDKNIIKDELIDCSKYQKTVDYTVCDKLRSVTYYEVDLQTLKTE